MDDMIVVSTQILIVLSNDWNSILVFGIYFSYYADL